MGNMDHGGVCYCGRPVVPGIGINIGLGSRGSVKPGKTTWHHVGFCSYEHRDEFLGYGNIDALAIGKVRLSYQRNGSLVEDPIFQEKARQQKVEAIRRALWPMD